MSISREWNGMNTKETSGYCLLVHTLGAAIAAMASLSVVASGVVENTEPGTWTGAAQYGSVTVSNAGSGMVVVSFGAQDTSMPPAATAVDVVTGGDPSASPFAGNYVTSGVSNLVFKFKAQTSTNASVSVVLYGGWSGVTWTKQLPPPVGVGVLSTCSVSVASMDGWGNGISSPAVNHAMVWSNDIRNVKYVGVRLLPRSPDAMSFLVDSFILVGSSFASAPGLLVSLGDTLQARFGVRSYSELTAAQKALDSDGDGMTDVNEILTGTNPDDRGSVFAAEVVASKASGITIRWPCMEGCVYTISRASDLVAGNFAALPAGTRLTATSSGYMEFTDVTANSEGGPYFYRIAKE